MNKSVIGAVAFVFGAAAGSFVTWKVVQKKYMDYADEEIKSVKEAYSRKMADRNREMKDSYISKVIHDEPTEPEDTENEYRANSSLVMDYKSSEDRPDYTAYSAAKQEEPVEKSVPSEQPYIISPQEYGDLDDYNLIELTYYSNGVLTDDRDEPVENPERFVGVDFKSHFGEYEDDYVYVRNDEHMCDYQILRDSGVY